MFCFKKEKVTEIDEMQEARRKCREEEEYGLIRKKRKEYVVNAGAMVLIW